MRVGASCVLLTLASAMGPRIAAQASSDAPGRHRPPALSKPRVAPLTEDRWTDAHRQVVAKFSTSGRADNGLSTLLQLPELAEGVMPFTLYLADDSSLSPRHRHLLILRAVWLANSRPLWATYAARAARSGMTPAEIRRIAQGPD